MSTQTPHRSRSPGKQRENTALGWLGQDTRAASVLATARAHLQIQAALPAVLPAALASVCRVSRLDNNGLRIAVPSAAHAAKLRQLGPRIAQLLRDGGWQIEQIEVKVQAGITTLGMRPAKLPREAQPLTTTALDAFEALQGQMRPGPLADAIGRLLTHHRQK